MVHDGVEIDLYLVLVQLLNGGLKLGARAVLGADGPLLVELAQVEKVVDAVAHVVRPSALACGRYPDGRNADLRQMFGVVFQTVPEFAVAGQIPLKILHHYTVFHYFIRH